jgi:hypothetical protein
VGVFLPCGEKPVIAREPKTRLFASLLPEPLAVNVGSTVALRCPVLTVAIAVFHLTPERGEHHLSPLFKRGPST